MLSYSKTGYIVLQNGDTLMGQIEYNKWDKTPKKILFRASPELKLTKYFPNDIRSFEVSGKRYFSGTIEVEFSSDDINSMSRSPEYIFEKREVFLEQLVDGQKSLFQFVNTNMRSFFYYKLQNRYVLFRYKRYMKGNMLTETKDYQIQLNDYLENPTFQVESYDRSNFLKAFKSYYESSEIPANFLYRENLKLKEYTNHITELKFPYFKRGFIVLNNNDTIKGNIHYENWVENPDRLFIQSDDMDVDVLEFKTNDISSFSVANRLFKRAEVDVLVGFLSLESLSQSSATKTIRKKVLLEVLFDGEKKLFTYFNNEDVRRSFYMFYENEIVLLVYDKYLKYPKGTVENLIIENLKFRGQLAYYLRDCPVDLKGKKKLNYTQTDLTKYFKKYYECKEEQ